MALLIIDIESYLYRGAIACETFQQCKTDPYIYGQYYDLRKGITYIQDTIKRFQDTLLVNDYVIVLGDQAHNFRKDILPSYKANRKEKDKPPMLDIIRRWLEDNYKDKIVCLQNLEGDDTARIIYEDNNMYPTRKIIVGIDKDFLTVPCDYFRDLNGATQPKFITVPEARQNLMKQIITGDVADNYKGLPDKGQAFADKFVDENTMWEDIKQAFVSNGSTVEDYVKQRRVATLVGLKQYNFETGEVTFNYDD